MKAEVAQLIAQPRVEIGKRLVQQKDSRARRTCLGQRNPLLFFARQIMRIAVGLAQHADLFEHLVNAGVALRTGQIRQSKRHILRDREMGKQGVVLEDHADPTPLGR